MKTNYLLINIVLLAALMLAGCNPRLRVGELQTESQSVELGNDASVRAKINMGAGDMKVTGGAEKLLEADFTYNVAELKPEVKFTDGTLVIWEPGKEGGIDWQGMSDFRNEWTLSLNNELPMDLSVEMGAGFGELQLADLSLTGLDVTLGAGEYTIDLNGEWTRDLNVTVETGAANVRLRLPSEVGVRVEVGEGPHTVEATGLTEDGNTYTNAAYGVSDVTLRIKMEAGIGLINLEVAEDQTQEDPGSAMISGWVWHDLCDSGKDGQTPPLSTMVGCVFGETGIGPYHANGVQDLVDPLIEGVVVSLGEGECPSTGLAETTTIITDLSYSFSSLKAGTYCVSIDPQSEPNFSILRPGIWTYPLVSQGVISATVTVTAGEYKGMVNFGWDYQFRP